MGAWSARRHSQFTVTVAGADAMPLATTISKLAPVSVPGGTANEVETILLLVATAIVL